MKMLIFLIITTTAAIETNLEDPAGNQIVYFKEKTDGPVGNITTSSGECVSHSEASITLNEPLINNPFFMDMITHITRENIPERIVHAKGAGAFGYFEVTHDISHICKAKFLEKIGKKTPVAVRFSPITGQRGSNELNRDARGTAIKFYTPDGNFDLLASNMPVYFYKDPLRFLPLTHGTKRNPATNLIDATVFWDMVTLVPESIFAFIIMFTNLGIPASYRNIPGHAIHTFQVENKQGKPFFVKFHIFPDAGIKTLQPKEAKNITDSDYFTRDLFNSIAKGESPTWTISVQIMHTNDTNELGPSAYDVTKIISIDKYPLHQIGKLVLTTNPRNYFAEIEQLAFCPCNLVPGILGAPDKLFESRRLAYRETQMHRLGINFNKISVNCPFQVKNNHFTYNRDGRAPVGENENDIPNYYPNSFNGPVPCKDKNKSHLINIVEEKPDNFDQVAEFYKQLILHEKRQLIQNLVEYLQHVRAEHVLRRVIKLFKTIHPDLGNRVARKLNSNTKTNV